MSAVPGIILDLIILVLLAATIFYSVRLAAGLKAFRESRSELSSLLEKLSVSIEQAEEAIAGLRVAARESGNELQETINQARSLSEELQFINEAGDNLAKRLEDLASRSGKSLAARENSHEEEETYFSDPGLERIFRKPEQEENPPVSEKKNIKSPVSPFTIRDRDFDRGEQPADIPPEEFGGTENDPGSDGLRTRAERDLYAALMQKRKKKAGR